MDGLRNCLSQTSRVTKRLRKAASHLDSLQNEIPELQLRNPVLRPRPRKSLDLRPLLGRRLTFRGLAARPLPWRTRPTRTAETSIRGRRLYLAVCPRIPPAVARVDLVAAETAQLDPAPRERKGGREAAVSEAKAPPGPPSPRPGPPGGWRRMPPGPAALTS